MKIYIEVSDDNEGTTAPFWIILDPVRNKGYNIRGLAHQITGLFFSRKEAEEYLKRFSYRYSERATVYCKTGCSGEQYANQFNDNYYKKQKGEGNGG